MGEIATLVVAEKPSLARSIAEVLGSQSKRDGYIQCGTWYVTWCFGHLLEQASPEKYGWQQWDLKILPMIPSKWKIEPRKDAQVKKQIKVIKGLSAKAGEIINAGDPDREGQLLVDEVLEYLGVNKPVKRIWLSATDPVSVKKALQKLEDNKKYRPLRDAAMSRSKADWLVGMNLTRAVTLRAQAQVGRRSVLPIGRVQTPTLAIVVARDREIEGFVPIDFFVPMANLVHDNGEFDVVWKPDVEEELELDESGRLIDQERAEQVCAEAAEKNGRVVDVSEKERKKSPELPHKLSTLQKEVYGRYKLEPAETLKIAQGLYEKGVLSYPRTDNRYLPDEQLPEAKRILGSLVGKGLGAGKADSSLKSSVWNSKKVGAHHAIIPTGSMEKLSDSEWKVFEVAARGYIRQFYPDMRYLEQVIVVQIGEEEWKANGRVMLDPGWTVVDQIRSLAAQLPSGMKQGDDVFCQKSWFERKKTTPPPRFNKASLVEAMGNVHIFVKNEEHKKKLKETSGLGTEATRTGIVEGLVKRKLLKTNKSQVISSDSGRALIDSVPESLHDPGLTALWEDALEMVSQGVLSEEEFMANQEESVAWMVEQVASSDFSVFRNVDDPGKKFKSSPKKSASKGSAKAEAQVCPECKENSLVRRKSKKGSWYWGCFNKEKHTDNGPVFLSDKNKKPVWKN